MIIFIEIITRGGDLSTFENKLTIIGYGLSKFWINLDFSEVVFLCQIKVRIKLREILKNLKSV